MTVLNAEKMICHGHKIEIKYLGTGRFEKIVMYGKREMPLYSIHKEISSLPAEKDYLITRREYFDNVLCRTYKGWRNSFIEFCKKLQRYEKFPSLLQFYVAGKDLCLSSPVTILYLGYYKKFFGEK